MLEHLVVLARKQKQMDTFWQQAEQHIKLASLNQLKSSTIPSPNGVLTEAEMKTLYGRLPALYQYVINNFPRIPANDEDGDSENNLNQFVANWNVFLRATKACEQVLHPLVTTNLLLIFFFRTICIVRQNSLIRFQLSV